MQLLRLPATVLFFIGLSLPFADSANVTAAEPPAIDRLVPSGGQRGTTVDVKVVGKPGDGTLAVWSSHGQIQVVFSEKFDTATVEIPADAAVGLHWLRFSNEHGATDLRPFIVGTISEIAEVEPNSKLSEAQAVESSTVTINGVLSDAVDMFRIQATAGQTLIAQLEANRQLGSPMDGVLQVLNADGTVVASNDDDRGFDPRIVYPVTNDGDYFVRTFAFPAKPNSSIVLSTSAAYVYRLTLTTGPYVDYVSPAAVAKNGETSVTAQGWNLAESPTVVKVKTAIAEHAMIASDFAAAVYAPANEYCNQVEEAGTKQSLTVPSSMTGVIAEASQSDVYTLVGKKSQKLTICVAAREFGSQLDPVVTVKAADGKIIKEADDKSGAADLDAEAVLTLPADGEYSVTVSDRFRSGSSRHFYLVTCEETVPKLATTVAANSFVFAEEAKEPEKKTEEKRDDANTSETEPEVEEAKKKEAAATPASTGFKPLEIPVTLSRLLGFGEKVIVTAEGLPDGVTAAPVTSEAKGDTAKSVTLKLQRGPTVAGFTGVISIVCTADGSKQRVLATAPIKNSKVTTAKIWLTVVPSKPVEPEPTAEETTKEADAPAE